MDIYRFQILNGTGLKLLALAFMTVDHIGMILFPKVVLLRLIGRLAFPIFAFMIAEGCYYTRNKKKYLGLIFAVGVFCQIIAYATQKTLYMCTLITFTMSVIIIFALQKAVPERNREGWEKRIISVPWCMITVALVALAAFITIGLPALLPETDLRVDYGFFGVLLPAAVYLPNLFLPEKGALCRLVQAAMTAIWILPLWLTCNRYEWAAVFSVIFLLMYNGERGRLKLKYLFYIYYPVHLGVLYLIGMIASK